MNLLKSCFPIEMWEWVYPDKADLYIISIKDLVEIQVALYYISASSNLTPVPVSLCPQVHMDMPTIEIYNLCHVLLGVNFIINSLALNTFKSARCLWGWGIDGLHAKELMCLSKHSFNCFAYNIYIWILQRWKCNSVAISPAGFEWINYNISGLIWNWNERSDGIYPESIIKIQNVDLVNTKHFKYLFVFNF